MAETYSVEAFLSANISGFKAGFDEAKKQLDGFQDSADQTEKKFAGGLSIGKIAAGIGLIYGAKKALDLVKSSVQSAFGRIDTMEQFERVMTTMTGSSKKANEVLDETNEIVKGTAYGLDVGAKAVQDFVTSNMDVDKATETVAAWGDAVAFYGDGSNESFASVSDALAKMTSKGKVQMDTMNRLTEAGIPAMQIYADATGQSVEQVAEQMSKGELDAVKFTDVMNDALSNGTKNFDGIGGAAKEAGASWGGSFANMRAAVARGTVGIIESIDKMLADNGLPSMRDMVADFGSKFEDAMKAAAEAIPKVVDKIKEIHETMKPWIPLIASVVAGIASFVTIVAVVNTVKNAIAGLRMAFLMLNTAILANPIALVIAAIVAAAILVYVYWEPISEFFIMLWEGIKIAGLAIWEALKIAWSTTVEFLTNLWSTVADFFSDLWLSISTVAISMWDSVVEKWNSVVSFLVEIFSPMIEFYSNLWTTITSTAIEIFQTFTETLATVWSSIQTIAAAAWEIIKNVILAPILLLINLATGDFKGFASNLLGIQENIRAAASRIWEALKTGVLAIITGLVSVGLRLWDNFKSTLANLTGAIKQTVSNLWETLRSAVIRTIGNLVVSAVGKWNELKSKAISIVGNIVKDLVQKWEDLKTKTLQKIKDVKDNVINPLKEIDLKKIGSDIIMGLIKGIMSKVNAVKDAITDVTSAITGKITKILGIKSPSRVFMGFGDNIVGGLAIGIDKAKRVAERAVDALGTGITDAFNPDLALGTNDIAGQVNNINAQANRQMQSHLTSEFNVAQKEPAYIYLNLGMREYEAFVEDISGTQDRHTTVKESFRN